jgi:Asp-tRNA(Asn)/Glu-tRNA(Gln) amidotransferase A subunit family amidase
MPMTSHTAGHAPPDTLNELSLDQVAAMIASRRISSEELVRACINRIVERDEEIQAWAAVDFDKAIAEARERDRRPGSGPLHGVPVGIKDVLNTADYPTQMGSPIYAGHTTRSDASCVAMLRAAGAIVLGKTVTCEFAGVAPGPTRNPLDAKRTPGGSSSGSGAAVADFMVPLALGTQTGGSVLRPASFCGVIGFKPTYGTVNRMGLLSAAESFDTIGLIARSLKDIERSLGVLTHGTARTPAAIDHAPRIGLCCTYLWEKAQPETRFAIDLVAKRAADAGAAVELFDLPEFFIELTHTRDIINNVERSRALAWEWANHRDAISPQMQKVIESGQQISSERYYAALAFAERCRLELERSLTGVDILLAPCVNGEAPIGLGYAGDPSFQGLWTLLHVPALSLPAVRGPNGMPVGIQVIARRYADEMLLKQAAWLMDVAGIDGVEAMPQSEA